MIKSISYLLTILLLSGAQIVFAQCPSAIPPVAGPVTTTESRCQSSGTATIAVSGGNAPYTYSIIAGPVTAPPQSSNLFQSLPPGSYTARVTDNCATTSNIGFTITGSYLVPQPATTLTVPSCVGSSDGSIRIDVTDGRPPFTYALISPSPITVPDQPGNVFTGLPAGSYTYRVTDSCGNFQTRNVVLAAGDNGPFQIQNADLQYEGCDSFSLRYRIGPNTLGNYRVPYTVQLTLPSGGTFVHVLTAADIDSAGAVVPDTFYFHYNHAMGSSGFFTLNALNNCGANASHAFSSNLLNLTTQVTVIPNCSGQYSYRFDPRGDLFGSGTPEILHCAPITYRLYTAAGVLQATQINNSNFTGYTPGNYKIVREDCCRKDSLDFTWATVPGLDIVSNSLRKDMTCKEGTVSLDLHIEPAITGSIILASGPPSVTFANGVTHTYTYPDTLKNIAFGGIPITIDYFTTGTYKLYATDSCGQKDSITFTVASSDLRHSTFSASLVKGCVDANQIKMQATTNTELFVGDAYIYCYPGDFQFNLNISDYPFNDSITNLSADTYNIGYYYVTRTAVTAYLKNMDSYGCDIISRTIVAPPYQQPLFSSRAIVASCAGLRNAALLPDSSRGVLPYLFQISSGPFATSMQPSPVFQNLTSGTYSFRMTDACGNSYSSNIAIDTLVVPTPVASGNLCSNNVATLGLPASPYISYLWQLPSGGTVAGDSVFLNPVTSVDTGTYVITATSNIAGCTNSGSIAVSVKYCWMIVLAADKLHFSGERRGENMILIWQMNSDAEVDHFIVERSADGSHFDPLQNVLPGGLSGNTYKVTDYRLLPGVSYYRLKVVHKNGLATYSSIVACTSIIVRKPEVYPTILAPGVPLVVVYPVGTQHSFVRLISRDGKQQFSRQVPAGTLQTSIDMSTLASGPYFVEIIYGGKKIVVQVLKQ